MDWKAEEWSNYACMGYVIKAMESLDMDEEEIQKVVNRMRYWFDMKMIQEADEIYQKPQENST